MVPGAIARSSLAQRLIQAAIAGALAGAAACGDGTPGSIPTAVSGKIQLDIGSLNAEGLYGPPDGLRSLDYEFCILAGARYADEVRTIAPEVRCSAGSRGRVSCTDNQALCLGSTRGDGWKIVLQRLAALEYVERIVKTDWE